MAREARDIRFDREARERLLRGAGILTKAVRVTLGPKGRNVVVGTQFGLGAPRITKDGVTVAKEIELRDKFENMGAQMLREVATRTSQEAGDGTTTATVLAHAMMREGLKAVAAGFSPMELKRGMEAGAEAAVEAIKRRSKRVATKDEIVQVATISANGERDIGVLLGEAMQKTGSDGVITLQPARGMETELDFVDGMQFDRGYVSASFITDQLRLICELEDPYMLVREGKLAELPALLPLMEAVLKTAKPLLVIADDFAPEVLATLVLNNGRGGMQVAAVRSPRFGEHRKAAARRHCRSHRRPAVLGRGRFPPDKRQFEPARPGQERARGEGKHDHHRRRRQEGRDRRAHRSASGTNRPRGHRLRSAAVAGTAGEADERRRRHSRRRGDRA